jgi:hypothetical protein
MILRYSFERENFVVFFLHGKEALFIILNYLFKKWLGLSPTTRVFLVTPLLDGYLNHRLSGYASGA